MDEKTVAANMLSGIMATVVNAEADALICLTELRRLLMKQIDIELEKWTDGLGIDDE